MQRIMPLPTLTEEPEGQLCLRCSCEMVPGLLDLRQQPFPLEWLKMIPELNGPGGRNVYGWGADAARSSDQRRAVDQSRLRVVALRCPECGTLELRAQ